MPLYEHGPGLPLINDEVFALSHKRINNGSHPGLPRPHRPKKEIGSYGPK